MLKCSDWHSDLTAEDAISGKSQMWAHHPAECVQRKGCPAASSRKPNDATSIFMLYLYYTQTHTECSLYTHSHTLVHVQNTHLSEETSNWKSHVTICEWKSFFVCLFFARLDMLIPHVLAKFQLLYILP